MELVLKTDELAMFIVGFERENYVDRKDKTRFRKDRKWNI